MRRRGIRRVLDIDGTSETPSLIRFGEMTKDELFVSAAAAQNGVIIKNRSDRENLVMLKHFGRKSAGSERTRAELMFSRREFCRTSGGAAASLLAWMGHY